MPLDTETLTLTLLKLREMAPSEDAYDAAVERLMAHAEQDGGGAELAATWERYDGPRGGKGWKNPSTGRVVYQEEDPNQHGVEGESGGTRATRVLDRQKNETSKFIERTIKARIAAHSAVAGKARDVATRVGEAVWDEMLPWEKKAATTLWQMAQWVEHKMGSFRGASQELVEHVVKERGLEPGKAGAVVRTVKAADAIMSWTENIPAAHQLLHSVAHAGTVESFLLAKVAYYIPVGSLAYLTYSTVRNPFAVLRAAQEAIRTARLPRALPVGEERHLSGADDDTVDREAVEALIEFLDSAADIDRAMALVLAALDHSHGDLGSAVEMARSVGGDAEMSTVAGDDLFDFVRGCLDA